MDLRQALRQLRSELELKQNELARALNLNITTVNRWETGKNAPNRSTAMQILQIARELGASAAALSALREALFPPVAQTGIDNVKYAQMDRINEMLNESANGVYICDAETYELLYINRRIGQMAGQPVEAAFGRKCYEFIMHRDRPCAHCRPELLREDEFLERESDASAGGRHYVMRGRRLSWNDRPAHIEYLTDVSEAAEMRRQLEHSRQLMAEACRAAQIMIFALNPAGGIAYPDPGMQERFQLDACVTNLAEEIRTRRLLSPEYLNRLQDTLRRLPGSADVYETELPLNAPDGQQHWVRFRARASGLEPDAESATLICSVQLIDREKAQEAGIQREHRQILSDSPELESYAAANLSRGECDVYMRDGEGFRRVESALGFDEAISRAAATIADASERARFCALHDRESLLRDFADGNLAQSIEYTALQPDGTPLSLRNDLKLILDPVSRDILLNEYCFRTRHDSRYDRLLAAAAFLRCEFCGVLEPDSDCLMLAVCDERDAARAQLRRLPYAETLRRWCEAHVVPEDRSRFLEFFAGERLAGRPAAERSSRLNFRATDGGGAVRRMLGRAADYLTEERLVLMTIQDAEPLVNL